MVACRVRGFIRDRTDFPWPHPTHVPWSYPLEREAGSFSSELSLLAFNSTLDLLGSGSEGPKREFQFAGFVGSVNSVHTNLAGTPLRSELLVSDRYERVGGTVAGALQFFHGDL